MSGFKVVAMSCSVLKRALDVVAREIPEVVLVHCSGVEDGDVLARPVDKVSRGADIVVLSYYRRVLPL